MCDSSGPLKHSTLISDYKLKIIHIGGGELSGCAAGFEAGAGAVAISGALYNYLANALRASEGDRFLLADNLSKKHYFMKIAARGKKKLAAEFKEVAIERDIRGREYNCYIGSLKGAAGEEAVERLTELGADAIYFFRSRFSQFETGPDRLERYRKIAMAASSQSRRLLAPEVGVVDRAGLEARLSSPSSYAVLLAEPSLADGMPGGFTPVSPAFYGAVKSEPSAPVNVVSGPEGGFDRAEAAAILKAGGGRAFVMKLKGAVLRAQFAPQAALAIIMNGCGDM